MNIYMVRLVNPNVRGSVIGLELHALSAESVHEFCERQFRDYEVRGIIEEGSEEAQRSVEIAEQFLKLGSYSNHPVAKTASIFALPAAKVGILIHEKACRVINEGARNAEDAARRVFKLMFD